MKELAEAIDDGELRRAEAIILSMTPEERRNPLSSPGPAACGSPTAPGSRPADVNSLLKDFEGARKMMRTMMGGKRMPGHDEDAGSAKLPKR